MNGAGGRGTSKSRRRVAGGSGSTSPDEVLERIGPRGDGELVSEAKFPASGSLQGISGILAQMGLAVFGRKWDQNCEAARLTKDQSVWWQCPSWGPL